MASYTLDIDVNEATPIPPTGYGPRYDPTDVPSESRPVRVVLYDTTPVESECRFWIVPQSTFGEVMEWLAKLYPSRNFVVLQANWSARPYWTKANPNFSIETTCRALYAVLNDQAVPYVLGVVRGPVSDYPIPIFELTHHPSATLLELIISSSPKLTGQIKSITRYSDNQDLKDTPSGYEWVVMNTSLESPVVVNTLDEPPREFMVGSLYDSFSSLCPRSSTSIESDGLIPPILQTQFVESRLLVQRAYGLQGFSLQMIHLSSAMLHVIISLARNLEPAFEAHSSGMGVTLRDDSLSQDNDLADLLRVTPHLSRKLDGLLFTANEIMIKIKPSGMADNDGIQRDIQKMFEDLCGDFPGAVTVRYSETALKRLRSIDHQELDLQHPDELDSKDDGKVANSNTMMELDHNNGFGNPTGPMITHPTGKLPSNGGGSWAPPTRTMAGRQTLGYCIFTNVQQSNAATLPAPNQDEALIGYHDGEGNEKWKIEGLSNGRYCFSSHTHKGQFAWCAPNPKSGTTVVGWDREEEWKLRKAPIPGAFLITTVDDHWCWSLPYPNSGTPIELSSEHNHKHCWWYIDWAPLLLDTRNTPQQSHRSPIESVRNHERIRYELEVQWQELIAWSTRRREAFHGPSSHTMRNSGDGNWQYERYEEAEVYNQGGGIDIGNRPGNGNLRSALEWVGSLRSDSTRASTEDPLHQLVNFDTVIVVDDSGSMAGGRWREARDALKEVVTLAAQYDTDGIDLCFLNSHEGDKCLSAERVQLLFDAVRPCGRTPTGKTLEKLLNEYILRLEQAQRESHEALQRIKPVNFLVITDGEPTDDPESVIVSAARRLDRGGFPMDILGIQFLQIGNDPEATKALKQLDDNLAGKCNIRDIVDTTPYSGHRLDADTVTKCLLGGINKRFDGNNSRVTL